MVIYEVENLLNGKKYIGKDSKNRSNYLGSGKYIKLAVSKYGKENFSKKILEVCTSLEELNTREIYWLQKLKCKESVEYYNATDTLTPCRAGKRLTEDHKEKISKAHKGKKMPPRSAETIAKQVATRSQNGNSKHSNETRLKMSKASLGKPKSKEHRESMSKCRIGVKQVPCSDEKKKKISDSTVKRPVNRLDKQTEEIIKSYKSIRETSLDGYNTNAIQNVLKGLAKTSGGFIWKYA